MRRTLAWWICALWLGMGAAPAASVAAQDWGVTRDDGRERPSRRARPGHTPRRRRPATPRPPRPPADDARLEASGEGRTAVLIERYTNVLLADPRESFAFQRLLDLYRERDGNIDALVGDLEQRAAAPDASYAPHMLLGHVHKARNAVAPARAEYARAAALRPDSPDPLVAMARLDRAEDRLSEARANVDRALALVRRGDARTELLREAGQMALDAEDYEAAERYYAEVARSATGSVYLQTELARALAERGHFERAVAEYERVVHALRGDNRVLGPVLRDMGRAQLEAGHVDQAIETLDRALTLAGRGSGTAAEIYDVVVEAYRRGDRLAELVERLEAGRARDFQTQKLIGRLHDELGHEAEALDAYRRALRLSPRDIDTRVRVVQLLARSGRMDEVIAEYRTLIRNAPREARFVAELAQLLMQVGKRDEALALADRTSRQHPRDASVHQTLAELYTRWGEDERASREIELLVRIDSQDPAHLIALGGQQLAEGRRDEAVATFRRILGVVRDRGEAHGMLAGVFADHDMLDLAEAEYRKASEADPDDLRHLRGLAGVLERAREGESIGDRQRRDLEAIETWQKVVALSGDDRPARREARRRIVGIWERRHQLRQRVAEWERAFAATPPDVEAGRFLAEARLRGRPPDTAAAAAILARISELEPGDVETLLALERTRTAQGDRVGAIDALRRLALADARRAPQYLQRMAEHAHALYRDDEAVRYAEEAVRRTPDDAEAHRRLGDLYRARQDTEHAVSSYQRAIELNDRLFATYFELAEIHVAAGRAAEADRLYREVLRLCPDDDLVSRAGRASMQVHLGAGTLETLERELLPLALSNPRRPIFRRMLVELYDDLTAPWLQDLTHPDRARAEAARAHLDRLGNRALKPLLEALADDDPTQRRIAIDVLGYLRNENAAGPLLAAAEADGPLDLRLRALSGAGALSGEALLTRYEAIARGPERRLRAVATWAIARIGGRRAVPTLRALLTHGDPDVRAFAILGLGHAHDRASTDALGHLLTADRSRVVQAATAWALGLIGDADDIAILALALERGDPKVRAAAALALGRIGRAPARAALADALFNADPGERTAAIAALARMSEERPDETLELPLLGSRTSASTYLELLLRVPQASTVVLDGEMSEVFEAAANKALGGPVERVTAALRLLTGRGAAQLVVIGSDAGRDRLLETLGPKVLEAGDHPSAEVRVLAVEVAAELGTQEAGSLLARRLDDDDPRVVRAVLGCVGIAQRSEHVVDRIEAIARGHRDWAMRLAAVEALGRVDPEAATDTLAGIVERDDFAFVREAAVLALGRAANERARAALERVVARDAEAHVRAAAARLLAPVEASGT